MTKVAKTVGERLSICALPSGIDRAWQQVHDSHRTCSVGVSEPPHRAGILTIWAAVRTVMQLFLPKDAPVGHRISRYFVTCESTPSSSPSRSRGMPLA